MTRFVVLTFAFLGWAFFEVSGGTDFVLPEKAEPVAAKADTLIDEVAQADSTENPTEQDGGLLARLVPQKPDPAPRSDPPLQGSGRTTVVLARLPVRSLLSEPEPIRSPTLMDDLIAAENADAPVVGEVSVGGSVGITSNVALTSADMRAVRGNRANMRAGPGKNYGVVATLSRGQRVEVLQYSGRGWVELKVAESGQTGWMAEFLLVEVN